MRWSGVVPRVRSRSRATATLAAALTLAGVMTTATPARAVTAAPVAPALAATTASHQVTYDGYSFMIDGKRTYLWSGEFHYFRLPSPDLWRDILQKMKAAG